MSALAELVIVLTCFIVFVYMCKIFIWWDFSWVFENRRNTLTLLHNLALNFYMPLQILETSLIIGKLANKSKFKNTICLFSLYSMLLRYIWFLDWRDSQPITDDIQFHYHWLSGSLTKANVILFYFFTFLLTVKIFAVSPNL